MRVALSLVTVVALAVACSDDDATEDDATQDDAGDTVPRTEAASSTAPASSVAMSVAVPPTSPSPPSTADTAGTTSPDADEKYEATIRRTTDGVAHISGASVADVVFGQGYASGQDHACTLADQLLKVQGRRAATFGPGDDDANLDSDFAWLALGIDQIARADWGTVTPEVTEAFEGFAAGWNRHLSDVGPDGVTGWCAGEPWVQPITAADLYSYARSVTLLASGARLTDFIASAQPPGDPANASPATTAPPSGWFNPEAAGSNAWAVGAELVTGGKGGLLVANPHFPWEGELRFWEVHLTVPGELDIYGANLIGLPGIGIGFTDEFAWSHTVSAGNRFTAYTLTLDPDDPTTYLVDGSPRQMTAREHEVEVLQSDGSTTLEQRTLWASEYGPIIDFPGLGWSTTTTLTYRDANIDNDEFAEQYVEMMTAASFDEFVAAHEEHQGVPLFNTISVSADGRVWYADTSATPNLSAEAEALYLERLDTDPITAIARDNGVVLLDGSDSRFVWEDVPGARDAGLVPFEEMPMVERGDYVFNANDSFWMPHATELLTGDYSRLHGTQGTQRSLRTRENATLLSVSGAEDAAGDDRLAQETRGEGDVGERGVAELLTGEGAVVARCGASSVMDVPDLLGEDGAVALPAEAVDLSAACAVLAAWDGRYDLDSRGAVVWRELLAAVRRDVSGGLAALWAEPFDPARPVETPAGLAPPGPEGDPVLAALARAVQTLAKGGWPVDVPLGDVQYALRSDPRIGLHGGPGGDGLTNVIDYADPSSTSEPMPDAGPRLVPGSDLRPGGYPVDRGTSFVMAVDFTDDAPRAWVLLTYGETGDRESELFDIQTERFRNKAWREATLGESLGEPALSETAVSG